MPEISRFFGLVIQMYYDDHNPPHVHARYQGNKVLVDFRGNCCVVIWAPAPRCVCCGIGLTFIPSILSRTGSSPATGRKSIRSPRWSEVPHVEFQRGHSP